MGLGIGIFLSKERRFIMPTYEFRCEKCKVDFTLFMTIKEFEATKYQCPKCKEKKVTQLVVPFQAMTSKKS
jgi:putative FmdB family regulatory protein